LLPAGENRCVLQLGTREKELLLTLLKLYPRVPPAHHRLTRGGAVPEPQAAQRLLDEALAEQRARSKRQLQALFAEPGRWTVAQAEWKLSLTTGEVEWLLQVLNDIRLGSWLALGSPETLVESPAPSSAPHVWAMEMAGSFQMALLHLLEARAKPDA
jgi:hypothetical protein